MYLNSIKLRLKVSITKFVDDIKGETAIKREDDRRKMQDLQCLGMDGKKNLNLSAQFQKAAARINAVLNQLHKKLPS
jgi:hypothetical protein